MAWVAVMQPWHDDPERPCDAGTAEWRCIGTSCYLFDDCDDADKVELCDWRACEEQDCDNCDATEMP